MVPVIPGAAGFGINTPAGRGGKVYRVTSLADNNAPGTLRHAINQEGPRVVVFEVSGTIRVDRWVEIANPFITIAGQTAPSPGIFLRGAVLNVGTHDVLIQHLRIAPGDDPKGVESENRDCLSIANPKAMPTRIVIDHCTFTWSVDESFSTWYPVGEITFRYLLVSEPLHNSIHLENGVLEAHGFGPLFYHNPESKITMTGNLISHCASRMPASGSGSLVMVNNFLYDKIDYMTSLNNREGVHSKNSIVGNVFTYGASCAAWSRKHKPITLGDDTLAKTRLYVADNYSPDFPINSPWDLVECPSNLKDLKASEPPVWNEGLVAKPVSEVKDWVTRHAGARPPTACPTKQESSTMQGRALVSMSIPLQKRVDGRLWLKTIDPFAFPMIPMEMRTGMDTPISKNGCTSILLRLRELVNRSSDKSSHRGCRKAQAFGYRLDSCQPKRWQLNFFCCSY